MGWFMVLGAGEFQLPLIRAAKARGLSVVVVSIAGDYPGFAEADASVLCDVRDKETVLAAARRYQICGIATDQTDIPLPTLAYVASELGLPGMSEETALNFTDKACMRVLCEQAGLATIPYRQISCVQEARAFWTEHGAPLIFKPVDNQGSRGVCKVEQQEELAQAFEDAIAYSAKKEVIVEKYIVGQELEADALVLDGEVTLLATGDVQLFSLPNTFSSYLRVYPSQQNAEVRAQLERVNRSTIQALGLRQGITHGEYILSEDGSLYLIEIAARGGGNFISSHIVPSQSGLQVEDFIVQTALQHRVAPPILKHSDKVTCYVSCYLPEGRVERAEGIEELDRDANVLVHSLNRIHPGLECGKNLDKTSRFTIVLRAKDMRELEQRIAQVRQTVKIEVRHENRLAGPIWQ